MTARALILAAALAGAAAAWSPVDAQQTGALVVTVKARNSGELLAGAQVTLTGTRLGGVTDQNGRFLLPAVPAGEHSVHVTYIGYSDLRRQSVSVTAGTTTTLELEMEESVLTLDQLVVTGVTEATSGVRAPFTIGRVSAENIKTVPTTASAIASIQGKVAGASIVRGSGLPGTGVSVLLRTPTSIQGSSSPMFVVDGVILNSGIDGTTVDLESLDIESIEVVKGAAAASLYGSRAASGVVAITTSRGKNLSLDQTRITGRVEFGSSSAPTGVPLLRVHPYLQNEQGQWVNAAGSVVPRNQRVIAPDNMMTQPYRTPVYDNIGKFFQPAQFLQSSATLSHRAQNTNFLFGATQYNERGALETVDGFIRNTFRLNLDHRLRSDFSLALSAQHSRHDRDLVYQGSSGEGGIFWDLLMFPSDVNLGVRGADGLFAQLPDSTVLVQNPLWYEQSREFLEKRNRTLASVDARYNPFDFLTIVGNLAYDRSDEHVHAYTPKGTSVSLTSDAESNGFLRKDAELGDVLNASLQTNLTWNIGNLSTRTVGRALIERQKNTFFRAEGSDFYVVDLPDLSVAADRTVSSSLSEIRSTGYFLEETLDYAGRYLLTALVRRDGSSLFGANRRWHNYYRIGGSWLLAEEPWFNIEPLSMFKLRYSIGTAGGRPGFAAQYETWSVSNTGAVAKETLGNRDLRPEHTTEQEFGIDMIVRDRYSLQLTYAKQRTEDQIIQLALPAMVGYPNQWYNTGVQSGHTYEATLEAQLVNRPGFTWSSTVVADRSRSRIDEWNRSCFLSGLRNICEGASLGDMWGFRILTSLDDIRAKHPDAADQFQLNDEGYVVWVGEGADWRQGLSGSPNGKLWGTSGTVDGFQYEWGLPIFDTDQDNFQIRQQIGSSDPDLSIGWLNNLFWRGFAFHTAMHAQIGGNTYNGTKQRLYQHERHGDLDQSGKAPELRKTLDYFQRVYNANTNTSHFVEDGGFLKLRALSVQYRFNQDQLNSVGVGRLARGLNLGVNARNIFTITNYSGFDPEVGSVTSRRDTFAYPNTRQLTFTAEITF